MEFLRDGDELVVTGVDHPLCKGLAGHTLRYLRMYCPKPRGGKNPLSDVEFYMYVREWCVTEPVQRVAETLRKNTGKAPILEEVYEEFSGTILTTEDGLKHVIETGALGIKPDAEFGGLRKIYD